MLGREQLHEELNEHAHLGQVCVLSSKQRLDDARLGLKVGEHDFQLPFRDFVGHVILEGLREAETGDSGVREHVARASMKTGMWREGRIASASLETPRERASARQVHDARVVTQLGKPRQ